MKTNLILMSDSYKYSHLHQYPAGTEYVSAYVEARGGTDETTFFGLQAFLKEYLVGSVITSEMIDEAEAIVTAHGEPFYREPWDIIVSEFAGRLPISIEAIPEGTVMGARNVQVQVVNTDPRFYWLPSFLETTILRAVWYPSTVATKSRDAKKVIRKYLQETSDVPVEAQIMFKLHDFGGRGVSSGESAMLGGMGHLVNFMGTDTIEAIVGARRYYNEPMAGFSIPASEHSTITSWGRENEVEAFRNMLTLFGGTGKIFACVSDSYNIYDAVRNLWGKELKELVQTNGGTLVVRPDSGDPETVPVTIIGILADVFGYTINSKGYKVLPSYIRVIQGDGINEETLPKILFNLKTAGYSTENIAMGMGGGLLQAWNRDTLRYAMKTSAICINGEWHDVYKDPVDDSGKKSKRGRLALIDMGGVGSSSLYTIPLSVLKSTDKNKLKEVFRDGKLLIDDTLATIRERAELKEEFVYVGRYD